MRIPDRHVDACDDPAQQAIHTGQSQPLVHGLMHHAGTQVDAGQVIAQLLHHRHQSARQHRGNGKDIAAPDHALVGFQVDQDQWRGGHRPATGYKGAIHGHIDGAGPDAFDTHDLLSSTCIAAYAHSHRFTRIPPCLF